MALTAAELQMIITARDRASQTLKNLQRETKGTSNAFAALGKGVAVVGVAMAAAAAGGVALFTKGLVDCVGEASEAQQVTAQLGAVLKSTGGVAGVTSSMATRLADGLGLVTRFGDEAILSAENLLLTFTNIGQDVFPQVTETVLDMAQSMGIDLKSAAQVVGKALNLPKEGVAALTRYGVQFTKATKDQIRVLTDSGRLQEAQAIILKELQTEFGGAARAAGATFAGGIDIAKNAVGNLKEAVGEPLLKPLGSVVAKFIEFATRDDIVAAARDVGQSFANIAEQAAPALIEGLTNIVRFGRDAIGTVSDVVDILSGSYQDDMNLNFFGQPGSDYVPSMAQRLSDAIREGDWSAVTEAIKEKGLALGAEMLVGIQDGLTGLPDTVSVSLDSLSAWVNSAEGKAAISGVGYSIADILLGSIARQPTAGSSNDAIWQWIVNADAAITQWKTDIGQLGIDIGSALIDGIVQYVTEEFWPRLLSALGLSRTDAEISAEGEKSGQAFADGVQTGLSSKEVYLPVILKGSQGESTSVGTSRGGTPWYENIPGYAAGGYFRVPEGFPNDTFPILVQSGEHVAVWPRGMEPPAFDTGYYPGTYQPGPVPSGGGTSIVNSPGATVNYNNAGASSLGLAGLAGYQMQGGPAWDTSGYQNNLPYYGAIQNWNLGAGGSVTQGGWIGSIISNMAAPAGSEIKSLLQNVFDAWEYQARQGIQYGERTSADLKTRLSNYISDLVMEPGMTMQDAAAQVYNELIARFQRADDPMRRKFAHQLSSFLPDLQQIVTNTGASLAQSVSRYDIAGGLLSMGSTLGGFGDVLANRYTAQTLTPLQDQITAAQAALQQIDVIENQRLTTIGSLASATVDLTNLQDEYNQSLMNGYLPVDLLDLAAEITAQQDRVVVLQEQADALQAQRDAIGDQVALTEQLVKAQEAAAAAQEKIAAFQKQQSDLAFLQAQLDFLQVIKENGLNAANILGGLELGINADLPGLLDAMTQAMQQIIRAAENEMGIHSKSRVMYRLGKYIDEGLAAGVAEHSGKPLGAMASMMAGMGRGGNTNNWYLTANYRYQDERSLRDDIWLLSRLHAGGVG